MIDDLYWDIHECLSIRLEKEPSYEEIQNHIKKLFTISKEEEIEFKYKNYLS